MLGSAEIARLIDSCVCFVSGILKNRENSIPSGEEAQLNFWYQFGRIMLPLQEVSLPQLIDSTQEFPVIPVLLDADVNRLQRIHDIKSESRALSLLLKLLLLGEAIPIDTPLEIWSKYGIAQISKARFNLATETYVRSPALQILFPSGAVLWTCCECSDARWKLEGSGVIGEPIIPGKIAYLSHQGKGIQKYINGGIRHATKLHEVDWAQYLPNLLYQEAYRIATTGDNYFDKHHYQPFWKLWQNFNTKVVRREDMQSTHVLPDGGTFVTGSHNKIPKGFQPKESSAWQPTKTKRRRKL